MRNITIILGIILFAIILYYKCTIGIDAGGIAFMPPLPPSPPTCTAGYIEVSTRAQLEAIGLNTTTLSVDYCLVSDIDLSAQNFTPIGTGVGPFLGNFDGNGLKITGLNINEVAIDDVGLFSIIGSVGNTTGEVIDLVIEIVNINGADNVGGLSGTSHSKITNVGIKNGIVNGSSNVGGLVGNLISTAVIEGSYSEANVNAWASSSNSGGLVGFSAGTINNSYSTGTITANVTNSISGGLVGTLDLGTIEKSYATGSVNAEHYAGGLVGSLEQNSFIITSYSAASVTGLDLGSDNGGFVGGSDGTVQNCYATGNVGGLGNHVGGFIGHKYGNTLVEDSYFDIASTGQPLGLGTGSMSNVTLTGVSSGANITQSGLDYIDTGNGNLIIFLNWDFTTIWTWISGWPTLQ